MLDPVTDLKLNQLEVVDSIKERQHLMQVQRHGSLHCHGKEVASCLSRAPCARG